MKKQLKSGFTIVELLIVIVVIGILAAITLVTYNGIQTRSNVTSIQTSLSQVNKIITMHHTEKGFYPISTTWRSQTNATKDTFIPGLVPEYVNSLPRAMQYKGGSTFYYRTDATGSEYKLLFLYPSTETIPPEVKEDSTVQPLIDSIRNNRGWGYWSSGGAGL